MRIRFKKNGHRLLLLLPAKLLLNRFSLALGFRFVKSGFDKKQTVAFVKAMNRYRRRHGAWVLLEAQGADGTYVKVEL